MSFENRIALVTGAGAGIGRATALALAAKGATVAVLSRTKSELDELSAEIADQGGNALPLPADVSDKADMQAAFDRIEETYGRLDMVFANAGINGTWAPIADLEVDEWDLVNAVNLRGTFLTVHHAIPLMREHGGSIVITSSINGTRTFTTAGATAYATTKAGQLAFMQMAAVELGPHKIRVNAICPGQIDTGINAKTTRRNLESITMRPAEYPKGHIPLTGTKGGSAEEVADLAVFLFSDAARHITGTPVWIDGAQSLLV
ncbi:SDR family oxidoreductase [Pelagibacterium montanilacus]|uniref:SDR family oxidoreductase n=1 Tax=Pelagibacterium montanilacus TaxID=2185280 RepID=UPI000F8D2ED9|nr:SDR family NAD(P)-dependent oxidoreductase [Pelagibacterium montanilacus]